MIFALLENKEKIKMENNMDILIINPGDKDSLYITEHLGIAGLKSYVIQKGFTADVLDMAIERFDVEDAAEHIMNIEPLTIGLSLLDDTKTTGLALIKSLREKGYRGVVIVGGYFPTFSSKKLLEDFSAINFVVRGEGELTLAELMGVILHKSKQQLKDIKGLSYRENGEIIENAPRPLISNLDILPEADRKYTFELINRGINIRINATRGCWGQCSFCDISGFYKTNGGSLWRRRSVKHLVNEIEYLMYTFNQNYFIFNDDQFLTKGKNAVEYVSEFARELKNRSIKINFELMCRADTVSRPVMSILKSAGLKKVFLGIESFDPKQLKRFNKKITQRQNLKALILLYRMKIDVTVSIILADAYTGFWDLIKQFIFLFELKNRYFNSPLCKISINKKLEVYRGSPVYYEYKSKGLIKKDHYLGKITYRMKFWTALRIFLFKIEEALTIKRVMRKKRENEGTGKELSYKLN